MVIFDFDQTLVDTSPVENLRANRDWRGVMSRASSLQVYDGMTSLLRDLRAAGETVAIVTKSPDMVAKAFIREHDWPIEIVVGFHQVRRRKPDPEGLLLALRQAGASAADSCHVGDRPEDTEAARAAGMLAIGAAWGLDDAAALHASGPDHLFETVADLRTFLSSRR